MKFFLFFAFIFGSEWAFSDIEMIGKEVTTNNGKTEAADRHILEVSEFTATKIEQKSLPVSLFDIPPKGYQMMSQTPAKASSQGKH